MRTITIKSVLLLCMLFLSMQGLHAQNQITGTIRDAAGEPLAYATVMLCTAADTTLVHGMFSTEEGVFLFENIPAGSFLLRFSMLGFKQGFTKTITLSEKPARKELDIIASVDDTDVLNEVQIIAARPFLEQKIDRTVVNVANSITKAGGTALQVLQRSPGVQVNALTKTIAMSGKQGVIVMINGKISRMPADAVVDMLAGMNADNIDRIELIHMPPANFEAEGNAGIINIVLKSSGDNGLNGGYSANGGYGRGAKYGFGGYFNYRKNNLNVFGNYDHNFNMTPQVFTNYRRVKQGNDVLETDTYSDRPHTPTTTQNARIGADFQVSKKTVIGVLGSFFDRNWYMEAVGNTKYLKNGVLQSQLRMPNTETNHNRSLAGNINLNHQFSANQSLSFDADFIHYDINNPSHYALENRSPSGKITDQSELRITKKTPIQVMVAKADYSIALSTDAKLEIGGKITSLRFDNDVQVESREGQQDWMVIADLTSVFHLDEDVAGAYTTFSTKIDEKTDVKAGLRYEYTKTNLGSAEQPNVVDRKYGSFFPSLFISRKISDVQNINLSYSRRITRPSIRRLAPWLIFSDPTTIEGGNPALQPSFTDGLNFDYGLKAWHFSLSYSIEHRPVSFVPMVDTLNDRQVNTYQNLDNAKVVSANLSFPLHLTAWWDMQNNFFVNSRAVNFKLEGKNLQIRNVDYGFNTTQTFKLPKHFTLEISGDYSSPNYWGVAFWKATGSVNIGLEKNFGQKWGKLRFNANDLFLTSANWIGTTDQPEISLYVNSSYRLSERTFLLSWTNTFGNNKLKSARQRQTGSAEEMRRI